MFTASSGMFLTAAFSYYILLLLRKLSIVNLPEIDRNLVISKWALLLFLIVLETINHGSARSESYHGHYSILLEAFMLIFSDRIVDLLAMVINKISDN